MVNCVTVTPPDARECVFADVPVGQMFRLANDGTGPIYMKVKPSGTTVAIFAVDLQSGITYPFDVERQCVRLVPHQQVIIDSNID